MVRNTCPSSGPPALRVLTLLLASIGLFAGCVEQAPPGDGCPCVDGHWCCQATLRCVDTKTFSPDEWDELCPTLNPNVGTLVASQGCLTSKDDALSLSSCDNGLAQLFRPIQSSSDKRHLEVAHKHRCLQASDGAIQQKDCRSGETEQLWDLPANGSEGWLRSSTKRCIAAGEPLSLQPCAQGQSLGFRYTRLSSVFWGLVDTRETSGLCLSRKERKVELSNSCSPISSEQSWRFIKDGKLYRLLHQPTGLCLVADGGAPALGPCATPEARWRVTFHSATPDTITLSTSTGKHLANIDDKLQLAKDSPKPLVFSLVGPLHAENNTKKPSGESCEGAEECQSGVCVDKVCCDKSCDGLCESCDSGACIPKPKGTSCGETSCVNNPTESYVIQAGSCNGLLGTCTPTKTACDPYPCLDDQTPPVCASSCSAHSDCRSKLCSAQGTCVASKDICYVEQGATGGDGSLASPHGLITSCLLSQTKEPYIAVSSGAYLEKLNIDRPVEIIAYETPSGSAPVSDKTPSVTISFATGGTHAVSAQDVVLSGIKIANTTLANRGKLRLERSVLQNSGEICLRNENSGTAALDDVLIHGCEEGIHAPKGGQLTLERVRIADMSTHGIHIHGATLVARQLDVRRCTGIGLYAWSTAVDIDGLLTTENRNGVELRGIKGGAGSTGTITNLLSYNNKEFGFLTKYSDIVVAFATLYGNFATLSANFPEWHGTQAACRDAQTLFVNSVMWKHAPTVGETAIDCSFEHSNVEGATPLPGVGNINQAPLFVDAANGDLRLASGSPCVDAATSTLPTAFSTFPQKDLESNARSVKLKGPHSADMGAYERQTL